MRMFIEYYLLGVVVTLIEIVINALQNDEFLKVTKAEDYIEGMVLLVIFTSLWPFVFIYFIFRVMWKIVVDFTNKHKH